MDSNKFIGDKYEIFLSKKYIIVKDISNNNYLRLTGRTMEYVVQNIEDKKLQDFLSNIFSSRTFIHKRKIICIKLKQDNILRKIIDYIPTYIFNLFFMIFIIVCVLIIGVVSIYAGWIWGKYNSIYYVGWIVTNIFVHELGHYIACTKSGRCVHSFGIKFNYGLPMVYVDTRDICMSEMSSKIVTSLGGVYFNAILYLLLMGIYWRCKRDMIFSFSHISLFFVISNLVPFLKLDGYYVISDLLGEHDLENASKLAMRKILNRELNISIHDYILILYSISRWLFIVLVSLSVVYRIYIFLK